MRLFGRRKEQPSLDQLIEALVPLVCTRRWEQEKQIIENYQDVLFTKLADQMLQALFLTYKDDPEMTKRLDVCRGLLTHCRRRGIDAVYSFFEDSSSLWQHVAPNLQDNLVYDLHNPKYTLDTRHVLQVVRTYIDAEDWEDWQRVIKAHRNELLTDAADLVLAMLIVAHLADEDKALDIDTHRMLLSRCRHEGIDAVFAPFEEMRAQDERIRQYAVARVHAERIVEAVDAFVGASTLAESKKIVETHRVELLTEAADQVFAVMLTKYRDDEALTHVLRDRRMLLARCRREGIDAAFSERL